jgi:hypothetical protein
MVIGPITMDIAENYSYQPKTIVLVVNRGYWVIYRVFTNNYGYWNYCALDMDDNYVYQPRSRIFTSYYGYWSVTLVIVNNYGYRTDIHSYWSITIDIGLFVQTACQTVIVTRR